VRERLRLLEMEQKLPYIHTMVGFNYRMTEMQSAIGLAELERMDNWNMPRRRRNAGILMKELAGCRRFCICLWTPRSGRTAGMCSPSRSILTA
jgi:dTDP-4-amino-4,6-dideoxygalactose transaminase